MRKGEFANWERDSGYASDFYLLREKSREGEHTAKPQPRSSSTGPLLRSIAQWQEHGRAVMAGAETKKIVVTKAGRSLRLYSYDQTRQMI